MNLWDLCPGPQHPPSRSVCDGLQRLETRALGTELKTSLWVSMGRLKRSFGRDPAAEAQTHLEKLVLLILFYKVNLLHSFVFPYLKKNRLANHFLSDEVLSFTGMPIGHRTLSAWFLKDLKVATCQKDHLDRGLDSLGPRSAFTWQRTLHKAHPSRSLFHHRTFNPCLSLCEVTMCSLRKEDS